LSARSSNFGTVKSDVPASALTATAVAARGGQMPLMRRNYTVTVAAMTGICSKSMLMASSLSLGTGSLSRQTHQALTTLNAKVPVVNIACGVRL
jgi:hypothetical protein